LNIFAGCDECNSDIEFRRARWHAPRTTTAEVNHADQVLSKVGFKVTEDVFSKDQNTDTVGIWWFDRKQGSW
jgi:hypothetical protein